MDAENRKKQLFQTFMIFGTLIYLCLVYVTLHIGHMSAIYPSISTLEAITSGISHAFSKPLLILPVADFSYLIYASVAFLILVFYMYANEKRRDTDKNASGDAQWNNDMIAYNKKYNEPFGKGKDTSGYGNIILAKDLYLSLNGSKTRRNCHSVVFGGSGAGKSYSLVKPNILQMNGSFIATDPKGDLLEELAHPLEENGYEVKIFNLSEMQKSMCYNPFAYIRDDNGVRTMVKCIIDNTRGTDEKSGDPIWEDSMTALLQAISFYMIEKCPPEERNFSNAMRMLRMAQIDENNTSAKSPFDLLFEKLEQENPESMAVMSYKTFRIGSGNTLKSILITCMTRLDVFNMRSVAALTNRDTIHLEELGKKRQALFIVIPAKNKTFNFLAATMYTQLFETLYHQVENEFPQKYLLQKDHDTYLVGDSKEELKLKQKLIAASTIKHNKKDDCYEVWGDKILLDSFTTERAAKWFIDHAKTGCKIVRGKRALPYDVRVQLDEFANVGKIPGFVEALSTMRSYKIWCTIILQNLGQLKKMWGDDTSTIIGNCDTFIFLGSQEKDMIEYVQAMLAKTTKRQKSTSLSYGKGGGSESFQFTGGNLMEFNQIREMEDNDCIVFLRGEKPFKKTKFDYHQHPKWELTGDCNPEFKYVNTLDNTKVHDEKRDKKQSAEDKQKRYEKQIEQTGKDSVISEPKDTEDIINKVTGGKLDTLTKVMSFDDDSNDLTVAEKPEDVKKSEEKFKESEEEIKNEVVDGDIWDMMSENL